MLTPGWRPGWAGWRDVGDTFDVLDVFHLDASWLPGLPVAYDEGDRPFSSDRQSDDELDQMRQSDRPAARHVCRQLKVGQHMD